MLKFVSIKSSEAYNVITLNRDFEIDDYFLKICIEYVLQLKSTAAKSNWLPQTSHKKPISSI